MHIYVHAYASNLLQVNTIEMVRCDHHSTVALPQEVACFFDAVVLTINTGGLCVIFSNIFLTSHAVHNRITSTETAAASRKMA